MSSIQELLDQANQQFSSKQYEEAIATVDLALKLKPDFSTIADASYLKARCYSLMNDNLKIEEALKNLQTALEYKETLVQTAEEDTDFHSLQANEKFQALILLFKGILQNYDENYETGLDYIEQSLQTYPYFWEYFVALNSKGAALSGLEKNEEAINLYQQATGYSVDDFDRYTAFSNLGFALSALKKYQQAIPCFFFAVDYYDKAEKAGKALRDRTELAPILEEQGWSLVGLKKYEKAIKSFDKSLETTPDNAWSIYGKAVCFAGLDQVDSALKNLKLALELEPEVQEDTNKDSEWDNLRSDPRFQDLIKME